jgi:HAD superfamily hydrolase (TIGR01509 family)
MPAMIRAIVFDFDGLMCDTETPEYRAWCEVFESHGSDLSLEVWGALIGKPNSGFDPCTHLETAIGRAIDRIEVRRTQRAKFAEHARGLPLLPGVERIIAEAVELGVKVGLASSSSHDWVDSHLARTGVLDHFDALICREDTAEHKPHPAPYLKAAAALGVQPREAIAFEDSPHGLAAAKAAGMFTVAVPNPLTARLDTSAAHLRLESLAAARLEDLIRAAELQWKSGGHP